MITETYCIFGGEGEKQFTPNSARVNPYSYNGFVGVRKYKITVELMIAKKK